MSIKRIIGIVLMAVSLALLVFVIQQVKSTFVFTGPRSGYYVQPYSGHAALLVAAIAGTLVSFLTGLFLVGIGRKKR